MITLSLITRHFAVHLLTLPLICCCCRGACFALYLFSTPLSLLPPIPCVLMCSLKQSMFLCYTCVFAFAFICVYVSLFSPLFLSCFSFACSPHLSPKSLLYQIALIFCMRFIFSLSPCFRNFIICFSKSFHDTPLYLLARGYVALPLFCLFQLCVFFALCLCQPTSLRTC